MLIIRQEQLQVLAQYMRENYEERLTRHIAADFPEELEKLGGKVTEFIRQGIEKAGRYGLEAETDVSRYIDLTLKFGPDFESSEKMKWTAPILQDPGISGRGKMDLILRQLPLHASEEG